MQRIYYSTSDFCIEFDFNIPIILNSNGGFCRLYNGRDAQYSTTISFNNLGVTAGEWYHFKLECKSNVVTQYVNGTLKGTMAATSDNFIFKMTNSEITELQYKNFLIYSI